MKETAGKLKNVGKAGAAPTAVKPAAEEAVKKVRRRRDTEALGRIMGRRMGDLGLTKGMVMARVLGQWPQICPLFAPWTVPLEVKGGVLKVAVAHDSAKKELLMHAPQIVAIVNQMLGYEGVQRLGTVVQPLPTARAKVAKDVAQPGVSLDAAKVACQDVRDDDLRLALAKLGQWLMAPEAGPKNKKG